MTEITVKEEAEAAAVKSDSTNQEQKKVEIENESALDEGAKAAGDDAIEVGATIGEDYETADAGDDDSINDVRSHECLTVLQRLFTNE